MSQVWNDLIDRERLMAWMDAQGIGSGPLHHGEHLAGGTQNILIRFQRDDAAYVLRRPSLHPRPGDNDTMRKEARVLAALHGSDVPHPALIAACSDETMLGAAFYLMAPIDGFNPALSLPPLHAGNAAIRHAMGIALIDGLVKLGRLDPVAVGLGDLGRPDGFLERQVNRWQRQLDSYAQVPTWSGRAELPGIDAAMRWLEANRPADFTPGIMHGDYHFANVMFRYDGAALAAIIDWELATIGDPLIDFAWVLATWPDPARNYAGLARPVPESGFPSRAEIIARYRAGSDRDLTALTWYEVLASLKFAIVLEGSHVRACAGKAPRELGNDMHVSAIRLLERIPHLLGNGR